jgi:1,4-dihydroxy-2-naphthoate octaprenyltransferase
VYQHAEDGRRGDHTLSRLLGIRGTFYFAMIFFTATTAGFLVFFHRYFPGVELTFLLMQGPVLIFFFYWFWKVWRNEAAADYTHTMWINFLSGLCLNTFFVYLFLHNSNLVQLFN